MKLAARIAGLLSLSLTIGQSCLNVGSCPLWPEPSASQVAIHSLLSRPTGRDASGDDDATVRELPLCVASERWFAGELGHSVLYRFRRVGRELHVGYFVYWTTERPWGNNLLSYLVLPAIFVDSFYSHLFFLFPGFQRVIHGPGDVEGARVVYEDDGEGHWKPVSAVADDALHHEVPLDPGEFVDAKGRVVLMTDVWSHQLGAHGARAFVETATDHVMCFDRDTLSPLSDRIADMFRLGTSLAPRRARPAWRF
jgi:hypothetical protein